MSDNKNNNSGKGKGTAKTANKTTVDRLHDQQVALRPSKHICESSQCKNPGQPIANGELLTTVAFSPKRRKHYFHKSCPR